MYRHHKRSNNGTERITAVGAVALTIAFQLLLLLKVIEILKKRKMLQSFNNDYFTNKMILLPFGLLFILGFSIYYSKKRIDLIVNSYPVDYKLYTFNNYLRLFMICILPLILLIILTNKYNSMLN